MMKRPFLLSIRAFLTTVALCASTVLAEMQFELNDSALGLVRVRCSSGSVQLRTIAGSVKLPVSELATLSVDSSGTNYTCTLINGDRWKGQLLRGTLRGDNEDTDLAGGELTSLVRSAPIATYSHQRTLLLLRDGSKFYTEDDSLSLRVYNHRKKRVEIPIGCLRAARFLDNGEGKIARVILSLPNGEIYRCELSERTPSLRTNDRHGNRLRIPFSDIKVITTPHDPIARPEARRTSMQLAMRDAPPQRLPLPFEPWTFKHEVGQMTLMPHVLRSWSAIGKTSHEAMLSTLSGDVLEATPHFRVLETVIDGADQTVALSDIEALTSEIPASGIPPDWMVVALRSRGLLVVQLDDRDPLIALLSDRYLSPAELTQLAPTSQRDRLRLTTNDGEEIDLDYDRRSISLIQLTDGSAIKVPWSKIAFIRRTPATTPALAQEAADWQPPLPIDEIAHSPTPELPHLPIDELTHPPTPELPHLPTNELSHSPTPELPHVRLRIKGLGTIGLLPSHVVAIIQDDNVTCLHTRSGSHLLMRRLSQSRIDALTSTNSSNITTSQELQVSGFSPSNLPPVTLRLKSGSIINATITELDLSGEDDELESLDDDDLATITSGPDGLILRTTAKRVIPLKRRSRLKLALPGCVDDLWLKLADLDLLTQSSKAPPPPTAPFASPCPVSLGMVALPGGSFFLGSNAASAPANERPQKEVTLSPFWMDACEVTRAQFAHFIEETDYVTVGENAGAAYTWQAPGFPQSDDCPVVAISWFDAAEYCNWRSRESGLDPCYEPTPDGIQSDLEQLGFRLPTEAEWEYAARSGGKITTYAWAGSLPHRQGNYYQSANQLSDGWEWTSPTKSFAPNALGLYDMSGNVWEWCQDRYHERAYSMYASTEIRDPLFDDRSAAARKRVMRGGSFKNDITFLRTSARGHGLPYASSPRVGFRCVRRP